MNRKIVLMSLCTALFIFVLSSITTAQASCWSNSDETSCTGNTNCNWREDNWGSWCEEKGCWNFSGTNQSRCENSGLGLSCSWKGECQYDGTNPSASCWNISDSSTCSSTGGCKWGSCQEKGCWSSTTQGTCTGAGF